MVSSTTLAVDSTTLAVDGIMQVVNSTRLAHQRAQRAESHAPCFVGTGEAGTAFTPPVPGDDSDEYERFGGTRISERRSRSAKEVS